MSGSPELEKQLKLVAKTGSYVVGRREVSNSLKGTKLLVWSASANVPQMILDECKNLSVPAIKFTGNPVELGRACGIPFRVSVIALKSTGDADLSDFAKASDYFSGVMVTPPKQPERVEIKLEKEERSAAKPKKKEKVKTEKSKKSKKTEGAGEEKTETKRKKSVATVKITAKKSGESKQQKKEAPKKKKKSSDEEENEENEE